MQTLLQFNYTYNYTHVQDPILIHTVRSFIELMQFAFTIPGVTTFLSNRICQDPLENFFGQQRQRGRVNENPNSRDFLKNTQALRVVNGVCRNVKGNCQGSKEICPDYAAPLPKRSRKCVN